jgi:hypothetical protein
MRAPMTQQFMLIKAILAKPAKIIAAIKSVHLCALKKRIRKGKNYDLDRYYTKLQALFERVFSHGPKRTRYTIDWSKTNLQQSLRLFALI